MKSSLQESSSKQGSSTIIHVNIYKDAKGMRESLYSEEEFGILNNINEL